MNDVTTLYLALLLFGSLLCALIVLHRVFRYGLEALAFRPIVAFSIFFGIIHFITPAIKHIEGLYRYSSSYQEWLLVQTALFSIFSFLIAFLLASSKEFSSQNPLPIVSFGRPHKDCISGWIGILLFLTGLFFALQDAYIIVFSIGYLDFLLDVHSVASMRSGLRILANLMFLGSALYLMSTLTNAVRVAHRIFLVFSFIAISISYHLFLNSRNAVLLNLLIHLVVWLAFSTEPQRRRGLSLVKITKRNLKRLSLFVAATISMITIFNQMTQSRYSRFDFEYHLERRERMLVNAFDGAFGNDENLLWLQDNKFEMQYGATYLFGFLNLVPSHLWPNKPFGAGPILINWIRPGSYIKGSEGNNSLTTGMLTEAFMNFGYPGILGVILAWSYITSRLMRWFHKSRSDSTRLALLLLSFLFSSAFLYQEFLGFFARTFVLVTPLFILGITFRIKIKRRIHVDV